MNRSLLHKIHLLIGSIFGIPFLLLGLSGAILVFRPEMERMSDPIPPASLEMTRSAGEIVRAARAVAPPGAQPFFFNVPERAGDGAEVRFRGPGGIFIVTVDPANLSVLAARPFAEGFLRQVHDFHENFLIHDYNGRSIIGWLGVGMIFLGCSGLLMWWPRGVRWRERLSFNRDAQGWPLLRELHRTAGFWSLSIFIAVCVTGTYTAFRTPLQTPAVTPVAGAAPAGLDDAVLIARAAAPGRHLRQIALPARPNQAVRVSLAEPAAFRLTPMTMVFVDQWKGTAIEVRDPANYSLYETFVAWQRPLHSGDGFGAWWRILVFLSGFLPPLFAVTGIAMWLMKRRASRRKRAWAQ